MKDILDKGKEGENALRDWFLNESLSHVSICQAPETFAPLFKNNVKRPDFILLMDSIGLIAVDAKNYTLSGGVYTLPFESELKQAITFERLFRMPVWYAYFDETDGVNSWYWISALKALEAGKVRTNGKDGSKFLAIKREFFEHIIKGKDLSKLYNHRVRDLEKISALAQI